MNNANNEASIGVETRQNAIDRIQVHRGAGRPAHASRRRPVVQHVHPPVFSQHGHFHIALRVSLDHSIIVIPLTTTTARIKAVAAGIPEL